MIREKEDVSGVVYYSFYPYNVDYDKVTIMGFSPVNPFIEVQLSLYIVYKSHDLPNSK